MRAGSACSEIVVGTCPWARRSPLAHRHPPRRPRVGRGVCWARRVSGHIASSTFLIPSMPRAQSPHVVSCNVDTGGNPGRLRALAARPHRGIAASSRPGCRGRLARAADRGARRPGRWPSRGATRREHAPRAGGAWCGWCGWTPTDKIRPRRGGHGRMEGNAGPRSGRRHPKVPSSGQDRGRPDRPRMYWPAAACCSVQCEQTADARPDRQTLRTCDDSASARRSRHRRGIVTPWSGTRGSSQ